MGFTKLFLLVALFYFLNGSFEVQAQQDFVDISPFPTVFESRTLPVDENGNFMPRQMASVGNGHVATTVYTDTVYMNGLYNGDRGESHRARIPSGNNIRTSVLSEIHNASFALDVGRGIFFEQYDTEGGARVLQKTFAHRYFTKVIVTQMQVTTNERDSLTLSLTSSPGGDSSDLNTPQRGDFGTQLGAEYMCAEVMDREDARYQDRLPTACTISTSVPPSVTFPANATTTHTFITAYGFTMESIESDFTALANLIVNRQHDIIYLSHVEAWQRLWDDGAIDIEGNLQLAKVVYGSLYYILSSLPVTSRTNSPNEQFYGLSPGGLAYGSLLMDYQGHSFWDTETWMYPPILYLYPEAAKEILSYRLAVTQAARDHAEATGYKGARFPWESAATGREVTPDCCPETRDLQVHISSDISFAIRQYISMTRDLEWLRNRPSNYVTNGCGLLRDIAEFWTTRSSYDASTGYHDIKGVMPPDEDNHGVDNNGYTNIGAGYSIFFAKYAECLCGEGMEKEVPEAWLDLAKSLKLLYDEEKDYHPEFEGYEFGRTIKQADVVLMGFPQLYDMAPSTRKNDLLIYANVTREDGPAMTWAMHTVGFLELDQLEEAAAIFNRSYQWYTREPFKIWTEAKPPTLGAINFITGMGGFLQSIFSGYGGLRVYPESITITKPRVLPDSTGLVMRGIKYLGNVFDADIKPENITLTLRSSASDHPLSIARNGGGPTDFVGSITYPTNQGELHLEITLKTPTNCQRPYDKIGTPLTSLIKVDEEREKEKAKQYYNAMLAGYASKEKKPRSRANAGAYFSCTQPGIVALTFDDGPSYNGWTESVLDVLAAKRVKATFFVTGYGHDYYNLTEDARKQALLRRIHQEGHQIASHTYTHDSLTANRTREDIIADVGNLASTVRDILGLNLTLLRPPYGHYNDTVLRILDEEFGYSAILWNLDTMDWLYKQDVDASFEAYVEALEGALVERDSFIVLHHDPVESSGVLAGRAIDYVRSKGFRFVTVGECIGNSI